MLLDPSSWDLAPHGDVVGAVAAQGELAEHIKPELMRSVVEIATPVCVTAGEVAGELRRLRRLVSDTAAAAGHRFASAGTHPFSLFERQEITDDGRYREMVDEYQLAARQQLIFGLHVHVAIDDPDKAIRVVDGLLVETAGLLALSASSPFWRGEPTGLASYRQLVFSVLPRTGLPPRFGTYEAYAEVVGELERTGCIPDYTRIWWDVRPHPRLGTVELRICDAVTRLDDAVAIAAYFQALVKRLCDAIDAGEPTPSFHRVLTAENKWLAARHGLDAPVIDLASGSSERVVVRDLVRRTMRDLVPHARELGSERELEGIEAILSRGNGADEQRRSWNSTRDPVALVRELASASEA